MSVLQQHGRIHMHRLALFDDWGGCAVLSVSRLRFYSPFSLGLSALGDPKSLAVAQTFKSQQGRRMCRQARTLLFLLSYTKNYLPFLSPSGYYQ